MPAETERSRAAKALKLAKAGPDDEHGWKILHVAYVRMLLAHRSGEGVRLSAAEVEALFMLDFALITAAENIVNDLLNPEVPNDAP